MQSQAMELKIKSLEALAAASMDSLGQVDLVQHVAAGMLLCSFEVINSAHNQLSKARNLLLARFTSPLAPQANGPSIFPVSRK